ncbi:MAG: TOBE domain-containing protein, partial [Treponema sp.]|nr:TOBE domain-containing protein [Treponema sp.]
ADFIGEANFLDAKIDETNGETAKITVAGTQIEVLNYAGIAAGSEASLVLRPENVTLSDTGILNGTVTFSTFMGSYQYYQVDVGGKNVNITDYNPLGRKVYEAGEKASLNFDTKGVYIL